MEQIGTIARRLVERCRRVMEAEKQIADRVEQSNVFPDATERRSATDAGSFDGDFTTPGIVCETPGNAHQIEDGGHGPTPRYQG